MFMMHVYMTHITPVKQMT